MSRGINKVILIGNLGNDPDVRHAANGNAVTNLSVATDESYKDKQSGQLVPRTEWHRVVLFGKLAEIAGQYLKKGSKVYLEGRLATRKWTDKENIERYSTEIVVGVDGTMQMLDGKPSDGVSQSAPRQPAQNHAPSVSGAPPDFDPNDDIPFAQHEKGLLA